MAKFINISKDKNKRRFLDLEKISYVEEIAMKVWTTEDSGGRNMNVYTFTEDNKAWGLIMKYVNENMYPNEKGEKL